MGVKLVVGRWRAGVGVTVWVLKHKLGYNLGTYGMWYVVGKWEILVARDGLLTQCSN